MLGRGVRRCICPGRLAFPRMRALPLFRAPGLAGRDVATVAVLVAADLAVAVALALARQLAPLVAALAAAAAAVVVLLLVAVGPVLVLKVRTYWVAVAVGSRIASTSLNLALLRVPL